MQNAEQKTALIAMSGGVDSSIAAYLMRQADFRCMGTTMRLYRNEDLGACNFRTCCSEKDIEDASEVAFQLDIPYEVLDFTLDFQEKIIGKFVRTYEAGGTPNPCIDCNREIKFGALLDWALDQGADAMATGHYARVRLDTPSGRWQLLRGADRRKDQTYFLYQLTQHQLAHPAAHCKPGGAPPGAKTGTYMGHAPGQKKRRQGYAENTKEEAIGEEKGPGGKIKEKDRRKEKKSQQGITGGHESSLQGRGYAFSQKGTGAHHGGVGKGGKKAPSHAGGKGKVGAFIQKTS